MSDRIISKNNQSLLCYALLGYLDYIQRTSSGDINYNFIFGPRPMVNIMKKSGVEADIVDVFEEIDQVESIIRMWGVEQYEISVAAMRETLLGVLNREYKIEGDCVPALKNLMPFAENNAKT